MLSFYCYPSRYKSNRLCVCLKVEKAPNVCVDTGTLTQLEVCAVRVSVLPGHQVNYTGIRGVGCTLRQAFPGLNDDGNCGPSPLTVAIKINLLSVCEYEYVCVCVRVCAHAQICVLTCSEVRGQLLSWLSFHHVEYTRKS